MSPKPVSADDAAVERAIALAELEIAGEQLKKDLARDPVLEGLLEKLAKPNISDAAVRHLCARINSHCIVSKSNEREYRERRERAQRQIIFKTYDPQEKAERRQRYQAAKARALRLLGRARARTPDARGLLYRTHQN